jgi:hypothetical protein
LNEESRLNFELREMAAHTFTLDDEDRVALATQARYWVDVHEEDNDCWHGSYEDESLRSGLCWQLLPKTFTVTVKGYCRSCPKCYEDDHSPMAITGRNHLGIEHLIHVGWPVAQAMLAADYIDSEDFTFGTLKAGECINCMIGGE